MLVINDSKYQQDFLELIDFTTQFFKYPDLCWINLKNRELADPTVITCGNAHKVCPPSKEYLENVPDEILAKTIPIGRVSLHLSLDCTYPRYTTYRKRVGQVTLPDWESEFVFVLAHELRHIDQYWTRMPRFYEVDAERRAAEVLAEFQNNRIARKAA